MKTLREIYKNHSGKVSDKWDIYLDTYEEKLSSLKKSPIKLFEIGVLNGGSLEIFSKYFENAELILGCDIDKNCPTCNQESVMISIVTDKYRCISCGENLEQKVNGVIETIKLR